jgi:hypothetical protein
MTAADAGIAGSIGIMARPSRKTTTSRLSVMGASLGGGTSWDRSLPRYAEVCYPHMTYPAGTLQGMTEPKMERLIATVPASLLNEVRRRAQAEDRSVSSIVRAALKAYMEGGRKAR